jgi:hypothetical protein
VKDDKKRAYVMEQVEQGKKLVAAAYKRKVKGFTKGMRVIHQWYGKGVITVVDDRETSLQSYSMDLDVPISLGGGERLNRVWVWPGHLKPEKEEKPKQKRITKSKLKEEKLPDAKPKRKRRTRKKK